MAKTVVVGGLGFLGTHLIEHLLSLGHEVIDFDVCSYASKWPGGRVPHLRHGHAEVSPGHLLHVKDMVDIQPADFKGADVVFSLASATMVDQSLVDARPFVRGNVGGFERVAAAAAAAEVPLILMSTDEVHGTVLEGSTKEEYPYNPSNLYAATKAAQELTCIAYGHQSGLRWRIARGVNLYGPGQNDEKFIPTVIRLIVEQKPVLLYGDGKHSRDWLFAKDACIALQAIWEGGLDKNIYNLAAGTHRENRAVVALLGRILHDLSVPNAQAYQDAVVSGNSHPWIKHIPDEKIRPGHDRRYCLDGQKIREALGWEPETPLEEGMKITAEWYLERLAG